MRGFRADNLASNRVTAQAASKALNAVANATITVTAATAGSAGNLITVRILTGAPTVDQALEAAIAGNAITVTLGTDGAGVLDNAKNTGTLVAAALDALDEVSAATSGSGAGVVAPVAIQSLGSGHDELTHHELAKASNTTVEMLVNLERGGNCEIQEAQRIADALSITLASLGTRF